MRISFFISLFVLIIVGCKKTEDPPEYKIGDGSYVGHFSYQGTNYFHAMGLDSNKYEEYYPGGVYYQKWPGCYTVGTYSVESDKLVFKFDSFLMKSTDTTGNPCNPDWLLPGEYTIDYLDNDSLVFERGNGDNRIIYYHSIEELIGTLR